MPTPLSLPPQIDRYCAADVCAAAAAGSLERRFPGLRELRFSARAFEKIDRTGAWPAQLRHLAAALPRCGAVERVVLRPGGGA